MRTTLLIAAFAFISATAGAHISIAPELGLNLSRMPVKDLDQGITVEGKIKIGVRAGANINIPFNDHWAFQPGVFYSLRGLKRNMSYNSGGGYTGTEKGDLTLHYAEIPLNLQYAFKPIKAGHFFAGIGAFFAFGLSGHFSASSSSGSPGYVTTFDTSYTLRFGNDIQTSDIRRLDLGGLFNLGFTLNNGIFFRAYYQQGFYNVVPQDNSDPSYTTSHVRARSNCFTFSIGKELGGSSGKGPKGKASKE